MSDVRELITDLRAHAHEAPAHCAALMRRAATLLGEHADPACGICGDSGRMVVGDVPSGVLTAPCACQQLKEAANAQR